MEIPVTPPNEKMTAKRLLDLRRHLPDTDQYDTRDHLSEHAEDLIKWGNEKFHKSSG